MIEIKLKTDEKVIYETLQRMGVPDKRNKILYPSCHLFIQDDLYYIAHFKEMFQQRQDFYNNISDEDYERLNSIVYLLCQWDLIEIYEDENIEPHNTKIYILPYNDKKKWEIKNKVNMRTVYEIGEN